MNWFLLILVQLEQLRNAKKKSDEELEGIRGILLIHCLIHHVKTDLF